MKKFLRRMASATIIATMAVSSISAYGAQLPKSIMMNGREFVMDITAGGGSGTATPDNPKARSSYKVLGSDVRLYIDYSHGHGGDHFAAGWVQATAPYFTARAEVWANGRLVVTGTNNMNIGDIADGSSYLAAGIIPNATPRIFYNFL